MQPLLFLKESWHVTSKCWCQGWCWTNVRVEESPLRLSLLLRWRAVCRSLCRLHGNGLCHFPYFGDKDRHANRSVQLQMVKWWVSCSASQWLVGLWITSCILPTRLSKSSKHVAGMYCKVPGDCIYFWKSGHADLHQMIPHIVFSDISPHLPTTDPTFIHVHLIPDSAERNDDKLYFFFREKSSEMGQSPVTQSRIGRICLVCTHAQRPVWFDVGTLWTENLCWFGKKTAQRFARRVPCCVWMFAGQKTSV